MLGRGVRRPVRRLARARSTVALGEDAAFLVMLFSGIVLVVALIAAALTF